MLSKFIQRLETQNGHAMLYVSESCKDDLHFSIVETIHGDGVPSLTLRTKCYSMQALQKALRNLVLREIAPA